MLSPSILGKCVVISIKRNTVKLAPRENLELMYCSCAKNCVQGTCPCVDNSLPLMNATNETLATSQKNTTHQLIAEVVMTRMWMTMMMFMTFEIYFYLLIYYSPVPNCRGRLLAEMGWWNLSKSMKQVVVFRSNSYKGGT